MEDVYSGSDMEVPTSTTWHDRTTSKQVTWHIRWDGVRCTNHKLPRGRSILANNDQGSNSDGGQFVACFFILF